MPRTVLVAETHAPTLELLREALGQAGYRVLAAAEPAQALELFAAERPDAVVIAVNLPRLKGATLGRLLRAEGATRVPIVAVDKGHLGRAKGVGAILDLMANAYVADPSKREDLLARLAQLVANAERSAPRATGIAATLARKPAATGSMKSRTLPELLVSLWRRREDGVLVVAHRDLTRRVFFRGGAPAAYDSTARQDSVGRFLLERGLLTGAQHEHLLEILRDPKAAVGEALVAVGAAQSGEPLGALLCEGVRAGIVEAYGMSEGRYSFYAGAEFAAEVPALELPALGPLYEAARRHWPARAFATALARQMCRYPRRTPSFAKDLPAMSLSAVDLKLALAFDGGSTLREVLADSRDLRHALALHWFLALTRAVEHLEAPAAQPEASGGVAARPVPRRKPLPAEKARELQDDAVRILTASYFGALGLDVSADAEDVERAYHEAATPCHPDAFAEYELGPIDDLLASVQDKLAAAYRVLSDDEKRKAYVGYLLSRSEVPRSSAPQVEAEIALKRGERQMRKGDWQGARLAFEQAVSLNPREPEYYGYLAWATFESSHGGRVQRAKEALKLVKKALSMNPTLSRLRVIAAILQDASGDPAEARRQLVKLLKAEPDLALARKALQALNRRHGGRAPDEKPPG